MAEALPVPEVIEMGTEVNVDDTWSIDSSTSQHADDPGFDDIEVSEFLQHHPEDNNASNENSGYFSRLWSGNMITSGCYSIIKSVAGGAKYIGHRLIKDYYQDSSTTELQSSIIETCQLILNTVKKYNGNQNISNILIQEKWLNETEYLLQNKILTVGVFGRHKAGKSTLLNALLYHEVLSVADTNETSFILRICHKPSSHDGSSCFEDTEQFLLMKEEEIRGRRNIRKTIHKRNTEIRDKAAKIVVDEVVAHVPFLCHCSTGDINIVLLDTPGLSESNELGISEVSEHQLMTCAVYVFVISCKQMEDSIDTDSLRAIVLRDPNAFEERRILIAVTRLDLYNPTSKDESDSESGSDDESEPAKDDEEEIPKRIESIKEVIQRQCKCLGVPIPDDCIIPLCATGALEARKKIIKVMNKKPIQESELSAAEGCEKSSQVPLLEEKLIEIASNSHYLWHYSIVRDCTRYLDQVQEKLYETKKGFVKLEKEFNDEVKSKEDILQEFKTLVDGLKKYYASESDFCRLLKTSYDEDIKTNDEMIDMVANSHFKNFQERIKTLNGITAGQFNSEAKQFIEKKNDPLKKKLQSIAFQKMAEAVTTSTLELGTTRQKLEQCLASYCETATSSKVESHLPQNDIISKSVSATKIGKSSPLKLSDLLEQSKVHYGFWNSIFMSFKSWFVSEDNPTRKLCDEEVDAFLEESRKHYVAGCHKTFQKIKPKIIEGYLKEHSNIAKKHIDDVQRHYSEQKKKMNTKVKEWRKQASLNKEMIQHHSDLIDNLEAQKKHLLSLAERHHGISLFSKHLPDE